MVGKWARIQIVSNYVTSTLSRNDKGLGLRRGRLAEAVVAAMSDEDNAVEKSTDAPEKDSRPSTALQLLDTLKVLLTNDEVQLHFDYTRFWMTCASLADKVTKAVLPHSTKRTRELAGDGVSAGPAILTDVLHEAVKYQRASKPLEQCTLGDAVNVLRRFLADEPVDKFTKAAFECSSGPIPEQLRPSYMAEADEKEKIVDGTQCVDGDNTAETEVVKRQEDGRAGEGKAGRGAASTEDTVGSDDARGAKDDDSGPNIREVFAARKKHRGRRLLRTRK